MFSSIGRSASVETPPVQANTDTVPGAFVNRGDPCQSVPIRQRMKSSASAHRPGLNKLPSLPNHPSPPNDLRSIRSSEGEMPITRPDTASQSPLGSKPSILADAISPFLDGFAAGGIGKKVI